MYSFSTFWTRILPFATADSPVNQAGLDHYRDLIDYCWSQKVEPVVYLSSTSRRRDRDLTSL